MVKCMYDLVLQTAARVKKMRIWPRGQPTVYQIDKTYLARHNPQSQATTDPDGPSGLRYIPAGPSEPYDQSRLTNVEFGRRPLDLALEHLPGLREVAFGPLEAPEQLEDALVLGRSAGGEQRCKRAADLVVQPEDIPAQLPACREG